MWDLFDFYTNTYISIQYTCVQWGSPSLLYPYPQTKMYHTQNKNVNEDASFLKNYCDWTQGR